jgi:hypothetical protein
LPERFERRVFVCSGLSDPVEDVRVAVDFKTARSSYREPPIYSKEEAVQYMLQIYSTEATDAFEQLPEDERNAITREYMAISTAPGVTGGAQLQPTSTATTVRVEDGRTLTTDGPFIETKEALGGYYLLEAGDLDAAIELAARIPAARMGGAVEVRPVVER